MSYVFLNGATIFRVRCHVGSQFESLSTQPFNPNCNSLVTSVFFHFGMDCQSQNISVCTGEKSSIESKLIALNVSHLRPKSGHNSPPA